MVGKISKNTCKVCKRDFKLKDSLYHHLEKHHGYEAVIYKCDHCFKRFRWSANLEKHMKEIHSNVTRHECGICASTYKYDFHLKQHMRLKHNPHAKPNKCPDCGVLIERRDLFLQHMKSKHPKVIVTVQCKLCPMVFISRAKLRHHNLKIHSNFERTKCPHCPSTFKWRGHLSGHIKKKHMTNIQIDESMINKELEKSRERTNRCRHCGAIFKLKFDLLVHCRRSHNENISIYRCCQCEAVFIIKSSLERHIVDYHKTNNGSQHQCKQCFPDINVKPIMVKVEHKENKQDERNNLDESNFNTGLIRDLQDNVSDYFEQTILNHPDLRDMILMKSQCSDAILNNENTILSFNGQTNDVQQIVEFEVPVLHSEMEDDSKIINANRDAGTQVNFYENMFCSKINIPFTLSYSIDGDLWKSLINMENPLRKELPNDFLSNKLTQDCKKKFSSVRTKGRKSKVRYRCEKPKICFNAPYSLDNHIQTEYESENIELNNQNGDVVDKDENSQIPFVDSEESSEKESAVINEETLVDKVLQVHLQKIDLKLFKNKELTNDHSELSLSSPSSVGHYDCKHCSATFRYKRHYFKHAYQKHGISRSQYNCSKCDINFDMKVQFMKHIRNFHLQEDKIVTKSCVTSLKNARGMKSDSVYCNKNVQLIDVNIDNGRENEENCVQTVFHECDLCDRKYKLFSQLRRHKTLKHKNVQGFKCRYCSKLFTSHVLRRKHIFITHNQLNNFVCKVCNLKFKELFLLNSHYDLQHSETSKSTHDEYTCETRNKSLIKKIDNCSDIECSDGLVRCEQCNKIFKLKIQLLQHKKRVHGQHKNDFSCNICKTILKSKRALKTHYNLKHSDYYCYDCDLSFRNDLLLQSHIEALHVTLENNLPCEEMDMSEEYNLKLCCLKCNLTFNTQTQMEEHIQSFHFNMSRDNETMTTSNCKKCNLNFNTELEMNEHIMEMHPTKKVTFRCSVCHARFNVRDNLLHHIDIEHRLKCGVCQVKFKIKDELLQHMATKHCSSVKVYNSRSAQ